MKVTITSPFARVSVELEDLDAMSLMLSAVQMATPRLPVTPVADPEEDDADEETIEIAPEADEDDRIQDADTPVCPHGGGRSGRETTEEEHNRQENQE